ncbi:MAG: hypothetical protein EAX81_05375 [Candidatus Thorarchaeota archaeon]|nr:hypothetical protein [Candidatus Thorarchaeota archaeon]
MELERVLTKLKFDEAVSGYALITNDGHPFLSFSLPDEVLPQIQGTLKIHAASFKLMNVMTGRGIVVLARVDENWVLAVLFSADLQLGEALQKTKSVVDLMDEVVLPPPPKPSETTTSAAGLSSIGQADESSQEQMEPFMIEGIRAADTTPTEKEPKPVEIRHGCLVLRGERYSEAMSLETELNKKLKSKFSNLAVDVLLMADEKRSVYKIADVLNKSVEQILEVIRWCFAEEIVDTECPEEQEAGSIEIVELPLFEGDIKKTKKEHRPVLALCNGGRSLQEIAKELNISYFKALQSTVAYRGKTLRFVKRSKRSQE